MLGPLADMTLCMSIFNSYSVSDNELKNVSKITDIFAPVSK